MSQAWTVALGAAMSASVLEVERLSKSYGRRPALAEVSFALAPGVTAMLGPNGAGKSTLIRLLATVERPQFGRLSSNGVGFSQRAGRRGYRRNLGWLPQSFAAPMQSSLRQFVDYVAWLKEIPRSDRTSAVEAAVDSVGLLDRVDEPISSLSGGMVRRLGLAQAVVNHPAVLLLDEPTTGLDPRQRSEFAGLITRHSSAAVLLATHLLEDVVLMADSLLVIDAGRVLFDGTLAAFSEVEDRSEVTVELVRRRFTAIVPAGL